jgi:chromosome segregation protein
LPKASHERESRSIETMQADVRDFEREVYEVLDRVAPELKGGSSEDLLKQLYNRLVEVRSASVSCRRLRELATKRAADRNALVARRAGLEALLDEACRSLGVGAVIDLPAPIARMTVRQRLEDDQVSLRRDLYEIADGHDEDTLRKERDGIDLDLLPSEIARETVRQEQLLKDISEASAILHQKQGELNALTTGRSAVAAAAERAEASAELLSIVERWLLRAAASCLAACAIERHRAKAQDPLIAHGSKLFAMATGGTFAGLGVDYGDDDQPVLITRRADGERVQISGLSEGTRDQLFLALRLALLERRTSEPMPFVGDDLLTSFDDDRALATLRLLAAAGQKRQIILFTHHRHVAELARSVREHKVDVINM